MRRRSNTTSSVPVTPQKRAPAPSSEGLHAALLALIERLSPEDRADDGKVKP